MPPHHLLNWLWLDMNAYFASVEQYLRPELRGRAIAVIPLETDFTSVIAASYPAKKYGIKVGTGVREAKEMCPGIILVKARPKIYVQIHHRLLESVGKVIEIHQVYSIDEWAILLRGDDRLPDVASELAGAIKRQVEADFGPWLRCSIGIAATRLLAKIAADLQKPNGLTVLPVDELPDRLEGLKLTDLVGIGAGMLARLERQGIRTVRELWQLSREEARHVWGSVVGARWWSGFHGHDEPEVATSRRSMSHSNVLEPRFRSGDGARAILIQLVCKLGQRLRKAGYLANCLHLEVKDVRGGYFSAEVPLPTANDTFTLLHFFAKLWERRPAGSAVPKKVGVVVTGLVPASQVPRSLFEEDDKMQRLSRAIDRINERRGASTIYVGSMHQYREPLENKIAFGQIPAEEA